MTEDRTMENRPFSLAAPSGKFRVVGVDTFDHDDWVQGDYDTKEAALAAAKANGGVMLKMHVYDDKGRHLGQAGTF
jgi:hypothetical protein